MPIIEEEIHELTSKQSASERSRIHYAVNKGQKKPNFQRIRAYQREYWKKNWRKYAKRHYDRNHFVDIETKEGNDRILAIKSCIKKHKNFPLRARVGLKEVKNIMCEELSRRCSRYVDDNNVKKKIMCLIGDSGTGKTLASLHLQNKLNANVICSFTTRPPRDTEEEGREHHFVDICPPDDELLAYAEFFGYKYYALKSQVFGDCTVYVIDEEGLKNLVQMHGDEYDIYSVYILRSYANRVNTNIDEYRMNRDVKRKKNDLSTYDYVVDNNSTKKCFFQQIEKIYNNIKAK